MEYYDVFGETPEPKKGILINGIEYSYSILQSEKYIESLIIKLYDSTHKTNIYFTYEASVEQLMKEIKFPNSCNNLDKMIKYLDNIFSQGNVIVKENNGNFNLELKFFGGRTGKSIIQLTKHEPEPKSELEEKIEKLEIKLNNVLNKFKQLKTRKQTINKEKNIRNIMQKIINDKNIIIKLFEEIEQLYLSEYNSNNDKSLKNQEKSKENLNKNTIKEKLKVNYNQINTIKDEKHNTKGSNLERFEKFKEKYGNKIYKEYNYLTGDLEYEGEYSNKKWNGIGKKYYKNRLDYVGDYLNGKRNGKGEEYNYNGNLLFKGEYLDGKRWNGKGYNNEGNVEYELKEGKGIVKEYNWLNGKLIYEGEYSNGKRNGKGKEYNDKNELIFEGEYLNGKKWNGKIKKYNYNGEIVFEGENLNGKKN